MMNMATNDFAELAKRYEKQIAELELRLSEYEDEEEEVQSKGMLFDDTEEADEECDCGEEDCVICCAEEEASERDELENGGWKSDQLFAMEEDEFEPDEDGEYDEDLYSGVDMGIPEDVFIGITDRGLPGRLLDSGMGLYMERMKKGKK
jgi:hypothetical protein